MRLRALDITLVGMFAALMAIGANITSWAPFLVVGGVPITLQTFFCVLAGAIFRTPPWCAFDGRIHASRSFRCACFC